MSYGSSAPAPHETVLQPPMAIIVGAPRSGTTLLRFMLDAHPEMAIPPKTGVSGARVAVGEPRTTRPPIPPACSPGNDPCRRRAERARYETIAGEVLERCGYEVDGHGET
jgi:hypothetical protein